VTETLVRRARAALLACLLAGGCSKDSAPASRTASARPAAKLKTNDSAAGSVDLGGSAYKAAPMAAVGLLAGTIKLDGAAPVDSVPITVDESVCGTKAESPVTATAKGLAGVIVWIADAKTGKALPVEKRLELSSEKCALDPRVQAVVVGTTMNVYNEDRLLHKLIFIGGAHDTLTKMPFFNSGQMVASERLATKPGIVEVRCALHAWTHGYIAVFDHPYFAVTDANGAFTIDSLAPGTYKMMVWHEGMAQPVAQQIQIGANGTARVDLAIRVAR
jgi:hypothetical protein